MRRSRALSHLLTLLCFLLLAAALVVPTGGTAQQTPEEADAPAARRLTGPERRLLELETKVSFNEAANSYYDAALIHQVVEGHGESALERAYWLQHHSPCVSGVLTQDQARERDGNCRWTRNLHPDGRRPRGWDRALHGRWSWTRPRWIAHIPTVRRFISGEDPYRPCAEQPDSWDGVRYGRACVERGEDCPGVVSERAARRRARNPRRVLDCDAPYTDLSSEEGLHNFAVQVPPAGPS
jgi:hypothetical protein